MKKKLVCVLLMLALMLSILPMAVYAEDTAITITGMTAPQAGQSVDDWIASNAPVFSPNYDGAFMFWVEGAFDNYNEMKSYTDWDEGGEFWWNFQPGQSYTLYLALASETATLPLNATLNVSGSTSAVYEYWGEGYNGWYYAASLIVYTVGYEVSFTGDVDTYTHNGADNANVGEDFVVKFTPAEGYRMTNTQMVVKVNGVAKNYGTDWTFDEATNTLTIKAAAIDGNVEISATAEKIPTPPVHTHNYGTTWKTDGTNHWRECSCGDKKDSAAHTGGTATCTEKAVCATCNTAYGNTASHTDENTDGKCDTCGKDMPTTPTNPSDPTDPTNPTNPTEPTNPTNSTDPTIQPTTGNPGGDTSTTPAPTTPAGDGNGNGGNENGGSDLLWLWIVIAVVAVVIGAMVLGIVLGRKKK